MISLIQIGSIASELKVTAEKIASTISGIGSLPEDADYAKETYENILLDEISHVQLLTLAMTKLATEEMAENADDSAFMAGELNSVSGGQDNPKYRRNMEE